MISLYIHIPYCVKKCLYCGFYSTPYLSKDADDFVTALCGEILLRRQQLAKKSIESIYLGGGTPTVLAPSQLERMFSVLPSWIKDAELEFTSEANPSTMAADVLSLLLHHGVNRLSIGIQSFSNRLLQVLERRHTALEGLDAFARARTAGFKNINIDLICGIPGQNRDEWDDTLQTTLDLRPEHISLYCLSLEENTPLMHMVSSGSIRMLEDDIIADFYRYGVKKLFSAGYARYEVSNFSLPGFECRHNLHYWKRKEYLGLGPSAGSFLSGKRYENVPDMHAYIQRIKNGKLPFRTEEEIQTSAAAREAILLGLRTASGINMDHFKKEFGDVLFDRILYHAEKLQSAGLLVCSGNSIRLTDRGFMLIDEALARLGI
ncbi:MAG: radical SAM family heme chaperone HemW [Nitrospirota bacterium]